MKTLVPLASVPLLLLLAPGAVRSFAPSPRSIRSSSSSSSALSLSPHDLSLLIADASDAVASLPAAADLTVSPDAVASAASPAAIEGLAPAGQSVSEAASSVFKPSYSKASYYTTLGLYLLTFPGLWSQIKRSTKAKVKRKTYVSDGEEVEGGKDQRQQAGEIMAYMKANNYEVAEAGETIVFRGLVARSTSQAFFLTFCTACCMATLALVLQIQFQDVVLPVIGLKVNWFYLIAVSPYAGIYYWRSGDRVDDVRVKLAASDDGRLNEVTIEGNDEEIDRMWRTLDLREKGMVRVEGILG